MATKKETAKPKTKKASSTKPARTPRKSVSHKTVQNEPVISQPEPRLNAQIVDEKSLRTINQLNGFLTVGVVFTAVSLLVQMWATWKAKFVLTPVSFLYIVISLGLIATLVWCIRLLKQKRAVSVWVFVGFMMTYILYTLAFRWFDGKAIFVQRDVVTWIVLAAILFELYRLKRKNVLI